MRQYGNRGRQLQTVCRHNHDNVCGYPETIGQYTGVTDVNSNKIFEGDIVISDYIDYEDERGVVQWDSDIAKFIITFSTFTIDFDNVYGREFEVVGNVYDNPEMMEKIEEDYE